MDAAIVVAFIGTLSALIAAGAAIYNNERSKQASEKAVATTTEIDGLRIQMDAWVPLVENLRIELKRTEDALAEERAVGAAFSARAEALEQKVRTLQAAVDYCKRFHQQKDDSNNA